MSARSLDDESPEAPEGVPAVRPALTRRGSKKKQTIEVRKGRRKASNVTGGIHRRANKRVNW
ncbi:MAG: hypothetical protein DCC67_14710 [Planctomycetota bacterium]|nr:MAG: hypothetical protein DCC67_14710 [Planctomycetota bacterium]